MTASPRVAHQVVAKLYEQSQGARWGLSIEQFQHTLSASVAHAFAGKNSSAAEIERYAGSLHIDDLALASACAAGLDAAWNHFVREHRPALYRAADAIDPTGGARELADALYADLFGMRERDGVRQSLFRYFHGRSKLTTWLRAVLAQRHVDAMRVSRRLEPLPEENPTSSDADPRFHAKTMAMAARSSAGPDPEQARFSAAMRHALASAVAALAPRDRLRLSAYYAQDLTLAAIGRLLGEHEATVSRHFDASPPDNPRSRRAVASSRA